VSNDRLTLTHQNIFSILAKQIRSRRKELRLSQEELAAKANLNPRHIQKIEAGELNITINTLTSIAASLQTPLHKLLEEDSTNVGLVSSVARLSINQLISRFKNEAVLRKIGLSPEIISQAIVHTYRILDSIDDQMCEIDLERLSSGANEWINLSFLISHLLSAGVAYYSEGKLQRSTQGKFFKLISINAPDNIEFNIQAVAGSHDPSFLYSREGFYLLFRYSTEHEELKAKGVVSIISVYYGKLLESDFIKAKKGSDNIKGYTITSSLLNKMSLIYQ